MVELIYGDPRTNLTIEMDRRFKPEAIKLLAEWEVGSLVPLFVGGIALGHVSLVWKRYWSERDAWGFEFDVSDEQLQELCGSYDIGNSTTVQLEWTTQPVLTIVRKADYSPSGIEISSESMPRYKRFAMSPKWDHKCSVGNLFANTRNAFIYTERNEKCVALELIGVKGLTVLKHDDSGWQYNADLSTNLPTMAGLRLVGKHEAFDEVITQSELRDYNP